MRVLFVKRDIDQSSEMPQHWHTSKAHMTCSHMLHSHCPIGKVAHVSLTTLIEKSLLGATVPVKSDTCVNYSLVAVPNQLSILYKYTSVVLHI